jgi:hypothetical protein
MGTRASPSGSALGVALVQTDGVPALVNALREARGIHRDRRRRIRQRAALALGAPGACRSTIGALNAASRADGRPVAVAEGDS